MRISFEKSLIVSDAHIGIDNIGQNRRLIKRIIKESENFDKVIFNGDMLETWRFENFEWTSEGRTKKVKKIFDLYPDLYEFMKSDKCEVIVGNHDYVLTEFKELDPKKHIVLQWGNKEVYIEHGNNVAKETSFETIEGSEGFFVIFSVWLSSLLGVFVDKLSFLKKTFNKNEKIDVDKALNKIEYMFNDNTKMIDYIEELNKRVNSNMYIIGHTHQRTSKYLSDGRNLLITGKCTQSDFKGIELDTMKMSIKNFK